MFKRLNLLAYINAMNAISNSELLPIEKQLRMAQLVYKSRGKSGKVPRRTGHKHMAYVRFSRKTQNKKRLKS